MFLRNLDRPCVVTSGTIGFTIPGFMSGTVGIGLRFVVLGQSFVSGSVSGTLPWRRSVTQGQLRSGIGIGIYGTTVVRPRDCCGIVVGYGDRLIIEDVGWRR